MNFKKRAFTLVELVIAIFITTILISGMTVFLSRVGDSMFQSQRKTAISIALGDFTERMSLLRTRFSSGTLIDSSGYDAMLFTNTGSTAGALVGVVSLDTTKDQYFLDGTGSFLVYGKKMLGVQELTATQVAKVRNGNGAYEIPFQADKVYEPLTTKTFSVTTYQSGTVFDVETEFYSSHYDSFIGKSVSEYPYANQALHFHLDF